MKDSLAQFEKLRKDAVPFAILGRADMAPSDLLDASSAFRG
ncbi:hypothetical protein SAMN05216338_106150 [Bradyrhizobium sp. Rc2d]|nr:hypothetical protein SAMN05216338_106150 [Bradyrhizobium sp. Rc2d]